MSDKTNYHGMSDDELNEAVEVRLIPDIIRRLQLAGKEDELRDFCNDPAAWGWLLVRGRINLHAMSEDRWHGWKLKKPAPGSWSSDYQDKPGRAVAIAYLEATEGK